MKKKISHKDKQDWLKFVNSKEKLYNKDLNQNTIKSQIKDKTIDLHGFSLSEANKTIEEFISLCFEKKINKITIITGKGSRSKNKKDPYQSEDLSILKHSIPEFIKKNSELMKMIKKINYKDVIDISKGSFDIILKNKNGSI